MREGLGGADCPPAKSTSLYNKEKVKCGLFVGASAEVFLTGGITIAWVDLRDPIPPHSG